MKKYEIIYTDLKNAILNGDYKQGDKLPTEEQMAARYGTSRVPVQQAMNALIGSKMVKRVIGSGTFVTYESHLALSKNRNAVFLLNDINPETAQIVEGAQSVLHSRGIFLSTRFSGSNRDMERQVLEQLKNDEIMGLLMYPSNSSTNGDLLYQLVREKKPLVFVDKLPNNLIANCVMSDPVMAMDFLVGHLVDNGHRRVALVSHNLEAHSSISLRIKMALLSLQSRGIETPPEYIRTSGNTEMETRQLLELPTPPTAILYTAAINYRAAAPVFAQKHLRIPEDISVVVHDEIPRIYEPNDRMITAVAQDYTGIGTAAAKRLYSYQVKPDRRYIEEYLPVTFVDHQTVKNLNLMAPSGV